MAIPILSGLPRLPIYYKFEVTSILRAGRGAQRQKQVNDGTVESFEEQTSGAAGEKWLGHANADAGSARVAGVADGVTGEFSF